MSKKINTIKATIVLSYFFMNPPVLANYFLSMKDNILTFNLKSQEKETVILYNFSDSATYQCNLQGGILDVKVKSAIQSVSSITFSQKQMNINITTLEHSSSIHQIHLVISNTTMNTHNIILKCRNALEKRNDSTNNAIYQSTLDFYSIKIKLKQQLAQLDNRFSMISSAYQENKDNNSCKKLIKMLKKDVDDIIEKSDKFSDIKEEALNLKEKIVQFNTFLYQSDFKISASMENQSQLGNTELQILSQTIQGTDHHITLLHQNVNNIVKSMEEEFVALTTGLISDISLIQANLVALKELKKEAIKLQADTLVCDIETFISKYEKQLYNHTSYALQSEVPNEEGVPISDHNNSIDGSKLVEGKSPKSKKFSPKRNLVKLKKQISKASLSSPIKDKKRIKHKKND